MSGPGERNDLEGTAAYVCRTFNELFGPPTPQKMMPDDEALDLARREFDEGLRAGQRRGFWFGLVTGCALFALVVAAGMVWRGAVQWMAA